jgi:hypothetical protein
MIVGVYVKVRTADAESAVVPTTDVVIVTDTLLDGIFDETVGVPDT